MLNTFLLVIVLSVELYHLSLTLTEGRRHAKPSGASAPKQAEGHAAGKAPEDGEKPAERAGRGGSDVGSEGVVGCRGGLRERKEETP